MRQPGVVAVPKITVQLIDRQPTLKPSRPKHAHDFGCSAVVVLFNSSSTALSIWLSGGEHMVNQHEKVVSNSDKSTLFTFCC